MSNILTDYNFNLSTLVSPAAIEQPTHWLISLNSQMAYLPIVTLLGLFGISTFILLKNKGDVSDGEALAFAGIVSTFAGLLLFIVEAVNGVKLLTWEYLLIFVVIAAIGVFLHKASKNY